MSLSAVCVRSVVVNVPSQRVVTEEENEKESSIAERSGRGKKKEDRRGNG